MRENKTIPVWGPMLALLKSRKVMVALATLAVNVIVASVPALESIQTELLVAFTTLGTMLVAAIAYEDGQARRNGG